MPRDKDLDEEEDAELLKIRMNRRRALSTSAKIGVAAGVAAVVAGVGGYFGGVASAPAAAPTTITRTIEKTAERTVTETVSPSVVTRTETTATTQTITITPTAGPPKYKFAYLWHIMGWPGFIEAVAGSKRAAELYNVEISWNGPIEYDVIKMREIGLSLVERADLDAILGSNPEPPLDEVGWKAREKGKVYVSWNTENEDIPLDARPGMGFTGMTPFEQSGYRVLKAMFKIASEQGILKKGDKGMIFNEAPQHFALIRLQRGQEEAAKEIGLPYDLISGAGFDQAKNEALMESYQTGHPDSKWWANASGGSIGFMGDVADRLGLKGKIAICGFDVHLPVLEGIKRGSVTCTLSQQYFWEGYEPLLQAWQYLENKGMVYPNRVNTGTLIVSSENVDAAMEYMEGINKEVRESGLISI